MLPFVVFFLINFTFFPIKPAGFKAPNLYLSLDKNGTNMPYLFFFFALSFILTHEMDAIRLQEWKLFIGLSKLDDQLGYTVFTALHIPLYGLIFWGLFKNGFAAINTSLVFSLDVFFIIHLVLHILFLKHRNNRFISVFSWSLILGAAICGAIDLFLNFI